MGDLFLHLPFARRLRFAEGLHPIAAEAMVRRSPALVLGASLPFLSEIERKRANWFRRLFMGGGQEAAKWRKLLENRDGPPRSEFILGLMSAEGEDAPGPMTRLAFGIGAMSTEILSSTSDSVFAGVEGAQREAVEGAIARLWMQKTIPNLQGLPNEWRPVQKLTENENLKGLLSHLERSMKGAFGDAPSREALNRWVKGLSTEVAPIIQTGGLPAETAMPLHEVDTKYFTGDQKFLERSQEALTRTVYLANRIAECFLGQDATKQQLSDALCEKPGTLRDVPSNDVLDGIATKWKSRVADVREDALHRGRNPEAAFKEDDDDDGLLGELPALPPLPNEASANPLADNTPNVTQEVSLSQIESEVGKAAAAVGITPKAPAHTQQVSVDDIEAEVKAAATSGEAPQAGAPPAAPAHTQQISTADIEAEVINTEGAVADAPTTTQQISAVDIQAELSATDTAQDVPTTTQQISAVDIQAEMAAASDATGNAVVDNAAAPTADPHSFATPDFAAPAHTQQVVLADIQAEVAAANPPPPPSTSSEGEPQPPPLPDAAVPPGAEVQPAAAAEQPAAEQPAAEAAAEQPAAEQPAAEQPATEQPATEQPAAEQPAAEQPVEAANAQATATVEPSSDAAADANDSTASAEQASATSGLVSTELVSSGTADGEPSSSDVAPSAEAAASEPNDDDDAKPTDADPASASDATAATAAETNGTASPEGGAVEAAAPTSEIRPLPGPSGTNS